VEERENKDVQKSQVQTQVPIHCLIIATASIPHTNTVNSYTTKAIMKGHIVTRNSTLGHYEPRSVNHKAVTPGHCMERKLSFHYFSIFGLCFLPQKHNSAQVTPPTHQY